MVNVEERQVVCGTMALVLAGGDCVFDTDCRISSV